MINTDKKRMDWIAKQEGTWWVTGKSNLDQINSAPVFHGSEFRNLVDITMKNTKEI